LTIVFFLFARAERACELVRESSHCAEANHVRDTLC
jgi:hypothetical protein